MLSIDFDSLGNETIIETIPIGGLEPDIQANTFEMTEAVKKALKTKNDNLLYSLMWDLYSDNNSCMALQSFKNWIYEVDNGDANLIQKAINRIEQNDNCLFV